MGDSLLVSHKTFVILSIRYEKICITWCNEVRSWKLEVVESCWQSNLIPSNTPNAYLLLVTCIESCCIRDSSLI